MNIETIRAFLEVSSTGSFQRAAENLNITQSAMSARIKSLEALLNRQLFNRKRNGASLTTGGQTFYKHALSIVQTWEQARLETSLDKGMDAYVVLGVQINHWRSIAAPWLDWMKQESPSVATQIHSDYSDRLMAMLRDGLINVAVLYEPQTNPDLVVKEFAREEIVLVSSKPRREERYPVEGYLFVDWGAAFRKAHSEFYPDSPSHKVSLSLGAAALDHILRHGGSAYLLSGDVRKHLERGQLHLVDDAEVFTLTTYLAYFRDTEESHSVNQALQGLQMVRQNYHKVS